MRGDERVQGMMFATVVLEDRVPADHPLRAIRRLVDPILRDLSPQFEALYSQTGRPSIPPEQLLRALLLQLLYSIRSERQLVEQLEYNLLYRWFVGLDLEAAAWHATTFTKNRQRLLDGAIAAQFLARTVATAEQARLLSREHFSVDGTLLEAWASQKSVRPKDDDSDRPVDPGNDGVSFHGEKRSNATHQSVTDPDARMARKSSNTASILADQASALVDNRHGLVVNTMVSSPSGRAEVEDAVCLLQGIAGVTARPTVGADKGSDTRDFVDGARAAGFTPHVAEKAKGSASDGRTTRHEGYAISQRARKKIEEVFGWLKTVAGLRKVKHRGTALVDWIVTFACAAYNLVRLRRLIPA
ncbi:MAG: IS5 family transposase [Gemmatimonadaceae bacterium]